jgi:cell shape-determining protein MreC
MRMSFARRNALIPRGLRLVPLVLLGIALLLFIIRAAAPNLFVTIATPLWRVSSLAAGGAADVAAFAENPATLMHERDEAQANVAALTNENANLTAKVADLERLLGSRRTAENGILAAVLSRPPESPYDTLIIDAGESAGVAEGAVVAADGGVPVGRVASAAAKTARVILFTSSGTKTDAWVGAHRIPVTLTGEGGGAWSASVPKDAGAAEGDPVEVFGSSVVGTVTRVDSDTSSPSATLRIQAAVNPFSILWVTVSPL